MIIDKILQDSNYKINQFLFSETILKDLEKSIFEKKTKKSKAYYAKCVIRDKDIRLTPEEVIRQLYLRKLLKEYEYSKDRIKLEYPIHFGREVKRADIVITEKTRPDTPYIIVEVKKPKLKEGKQQLKSYTNATGAPIAVWTNGERIEYFHRKDPNYFENIPNIPKASQSLKDLLKQKFTIEELKKVDKLTKDKISLKDIIIDLEDEILANAGVDVFEEVFKLIFTKLYDELQSVRDTNRNLEFRNYGETDTELKEKIQELFDKAKEKWDGIFLPNSKIELSPSHLAICVSSLQDIKIFNTNLDVIDDAFEYLVNKTSKGEKGQYFTPRYIIDMAVKMINPLEEESIIDPACGSFGFPIHAVFKVWRDIYDDLGIDEKELLTAEEKHPRAIDYVKSKVFGIDFDEKVVRVAKLLNLIAGDGHSNVIRLNSLDWEIWKEWINDEDWQDKYFNGWKKLKKLTKKKGDFSEFNFDIVLTNPPFAGEIKESRIIHKYDIAQAKNGKYPSKISRDILFVERALKMLKPGGRMAIVLPQGRFNNATDKYIREFISERARILAVVGLHQNVFKPHTGTKTSVLFVQKWDDKLCPKKEDYPIFFATMQESSKDNSGEKIYVKYKDFLKWEKEGKIPLLPEEFRKKALSNLDERVLDKYGHLIVKHDLYSVETIDGVKTPEGIAEAFLEFAKKENLSFVKKKLKFDEKKYKSLLDTLEAVELKLSEVKEDNPDFRIDSEFFKKEYLKNIILLKLKKSIKLNKFLYQDIVNGDDIRNFEIETEGIPYLRTGEFKNYFLDIDNAVKTDIKYLNNIKVKLNLNDILITRKGNYGKIEVVYNDQIKNSIISSEIFRLRLTNINTYFFKVLFISKYLQRQVERNIHGISNFSFTQKSLKNFYIPILSQPFQLEIEKLVKKAYNELEESKKLYKEAEDILLEELDLKDFKPTNENISIVSSKEAFLNGRLDAEYYQPKYKQIEEKIKSYKGGWGYVKEFFKENKSKIKFDKKIYAYIEIGDINITNGDYNYKFLQVDELPVNAKIMVKKGDILISTVRPNRGAVTIIKDYLDNLVVSGAFTVLREKNNLIFNKESLLVFFRTSIVREWLLKSNVGTQYPVIKNEDILNLPIPKLSQPLQQQIKEKIQKSFTLRENSKKLLDLAKKAVEIAIEKNEKEAMEFINENAV